MRGQPPQPSPRPPSGIPPQVHARRQPSMGRRAWTGLWRGRILGTLLVVVVLGFLLAQWVMSRETPRHVKAPEDSTLLPTWGRQTFEYEPAKPAPPTPPPDPLEKVTPELTKLRAETAMLRNELEALKQAQARTPASGTNERQQRPTSAPARTPVPSLFVSHEAPKDEAPTPPARGAHVLDPGTVIPVILKSEVNSEVPGAFTAKVSQGVYDSATHRHLLIPQGATVVGHDQSQALLYGNTRLPTVGLTLSLPGRAAVDLGQAPITDQAGVMGLTGDVNNHYGRLLGAVLIGGALKGGMQATQMAIAGQGAETQVAVGITQSGNQVVSSRLGRALDTRPTILLHAGQLAHVLLMRPLTLTPFYE